jgi:hypothetical protein
VGSKSVKTRHPVTVHLPFDNHRAMAAHWGEESVRAIRAAVAQPHYTTIEDLEMLHAVRCAKQAYYHGMKVTKYRNEP